MSEQLSALLSRYADDMTTDLAVPPAPVLATPDVDRAERRSQRGRRLFVPAAAAAAAVAVAVAATLFGGGAGPEPVVVATAAGPPVPPQPTDTPPPPFTLLDLPADHPMNGPEVSAPAGRERLAITLELPAAPVVDEITPYTVVISNDSTEPVTLSPCPAYRMEYGGQSSTGRLPCEDLPAQVAPGQRLRVTLGSVFGFWDGPDVEPSREIAVAWAIRGPQAALGTTRLTQPALPAPLATAAFVDAPAPAGEPMTGPEGLAKGMQPWWPIKPTIIDAPVTVRAGENLRYTVRLWNDTPDDSVDLRPCRGFTQWLQRPVQPAGEQVAFLDWSFERGEITSLLSTEHLLNCNALPAKLPARQWVQLEMRLRVPTNFPAGDASLAWKVGELDVFGSPQSRYVSVRVLPPV